MLRMPFSIRLTASLAGICLSFFLFRWMLNDHPTVDFIEYWSAAKLTLAGGNPYSMPDMLAVQKTTGWPDNSGIAIPPDYAHMMRNPPWALFFVLPLGFFDYVTSRTLFFLASLAIVFFSTKLLWCSLGGQRRYFWIGLLIAITFPATYRTIDVGQICILLLLSVALFLWLVRRKSWFWAGVAVSLILIKPHVLFLFCIALALWAVSNRCWRFFWGCFAGWLAATSATLVFVPHVFEHYLYSVQDYPLQSWMTFTPGTLLRESFGLEKVWLDYICAALGSVWLLWYWVRHKHHWRWEETLPMLVLASAATAIFSWDADYIVVLPAILSVAVRCTTSPPRSPERRLTLFLLMGCYAAFMLLYYFPPPHNRYYLLGIPAYRWGECLFACYLWIWYAGANAALGGRRCVRGTVTGAGPPVRE